MPSALNNQQENSHLAESAAVTQKDIRRSANAFLTGGYLSDPK